MDWKKIVAVLALAAVACFFASTDPVKSVSADTLNETTSTLTVSGVVDVTISATTIAFGSVAPGTANSSSTAGGWPLNVTIHANTNTVTNLQVNGTNMGGAGTLLVNNITYENATLGGPYGWKTELNATFSSGQDENHHSYNDWVGIPDPSSDIDRLIYWYINVPSYQTKGSYTGNIYVKVIDVG